MYATCVSFHFRMDSIWAVFKKLSDNVMGVAATWLGHVNTEVYGMAWYEPIVTESNDTA